VLEESAHYAQCVVTAPLQEYSVNIYVSITMFSNHTLPYFSIIPNVCTEVSQKDYEFVILTLYMASLVSSMNSKYSALELVVPTCIKHREGLYNFTLNMHTHSSWIHLSTQLVY